MAVRVTKDRLEAVARSVRSLADRQVLVGVPDTTAGRDPEPGEPAGITNALIGYLMEHGVPERNVPARPFLVPGVRDAREAVLRRFKQAAGLALAGRESQVESALEAAGQAAASAVREKIRSGPFAPLSPRTIDARHRRRGRTAATIAQHGADDKPLIDTGQLLQSITYVVRTRDE